MMSSVMQLPTFDGCFSGKDLVEPDRMIRL
jgi:hypothetical protein